jgi:hypothetical protein
MNANDQLHVILVATGGAGAPWSGAGRRWPSGPGGHPQAGPRPCPRAWEQLAAAADPAQTRTACQGSRVV